MLDAIQSALDFEGYRNPQFSRKDGLGRVGVAGFVTGLVFGVHLSILGCCLAINGLVLSKLVRVVDTISILTVHSIHLTSGAVSTVGTTAIVGMSMFQCIFHVFDGRMGCMY